MTTINWTTGDGREVVLTLTAEFELTLDGLRKSAGVKVVEVRGTLDGREIVGGYSVMRINHPTCVAKIGNVGISQANYDRYLAAYAEVESTIGAHNAACAAHQAELDAVTAAGRRISSIA